MKLAVVAQRYGQAINGGAELHARYIAEHLARHAEVDVLTTCAVDYVTWRNELARGDEQLNGVSVRRFPVSHERKPLVFGRRSRHVFEGMHSVNDELAWLDSEGPASPALIRHIRRNASLYDYFVFFSYRYYHAYHGARAVANKAVLVPTAERDEAIGLSIFSPLFAGVRALMHNSPEERAIIRGVADTSAVPSVVVGVGSEVPRNPQPSRFRQKFNLRGPFAIYVGRIDENKGCKELFRYFESYLRETGGRLTLVLVGNSLLPIPKHPRIKHLGFLNDEDKFDGMAAADLLLMPSYFESLSMVALEAWGLGRPVLANARCDVLKGQCIRSNAGLYYQNEAEFVAAIQAIEANRWISGSLGRNGRQFFRDNYEWPIIERKYLDMFSRLDREPGVAAMTPLPGWWQRRQRVCQPARQILASLPSGPAMAERVSAPPQQNPAPAVSLGPTASSPTASTPSRAPAAHHDRRRRGRHGHPQRSRSV
ncbi:MAG TPA: glycosyltransferase [Vicinamibacterales bacterium]|nr:glycosyltransferase [Vicinamibacterales bacterium]